eukprot:3471188-Rhodomonas_salina.1
MLAPPPKQSRVTAPAPQLLLEHGPIPLPIPKQREHVISNPELGGCFNRSSLLRLCFLAPSCCPCLRPLLLVCVAAVLLARCPAPGHAARTKALHQKQVRVRAQSHRIICLKCMACRAERDFMLDVRKERRLECVAAWRQLADERLERCSSFMCCAEAPDAVSPIVCPFWIQLQHMAQLSCYGLPHWLRPVDSGPTARPAPELSGSALASLAVSVAEAKVLFPCPAMAPSLPFQTPSLPLAFPAAS